MPRIFVLENDPRRVCAMQEALTGYLPHVEATFIDNAPDAIAWLETQIGGLSLISLDHDLGAESVRNGKLFDPGSGRDVARYLGRYTPCCPVILHTDNFFVRPTMQAMLDEGGWKHSFVAPGNATRWVGEVWIKRVEELLASNAVADPALVEVLEGWHKLPSAVTARILEVVRRAQTIPTSPSGPRF